MKQSSGKNKGGGAAFLRADQRGLAVLRRAYGKLAAGDLTGFLRDVIKALWPTTWWGKAVGVLLMALTCYGRVCAAVPAIRPQAVIEHIQRLMRRPVSMQLAHNDSAPPLDSVHLTLQQVPDAARSTDFEVLVNLSSCTPLVSDLGEGRWELTVPSEAFSWAGAQDYAEITVRSRFFSEQREKVRLARRPQFTIDKARSAFSLMERTTSNPGLAPMLLLDGWTPRSADELPPHAVGSSGCVIALPKEVVDSPSYTLALQTGNRVLSFPITTGKLSIDGQCFRREQSSATWGEVLGWHRLVLKYRDRSVAEMPLLHFASPLENLVIPLARTQYWMKNPTDSMILQATSAVRKTLRTPREYHVIRFADARVPFGPGRYIIEFEFQGIARGAVSVPFGPCFDCVIPAGPDLSHVAYKYDGAMRCGESTSVPGGVNTSLLLGHRCTASDGCEDTFKSFDGLVTIRDDDWHRADLKIDISQYGSSAYCLHAVLYLDGHLVADAARTVSFAVPVIQPEIRNWGATELAIRDLRVYRVPLTP